jgi:hypothetical protein
MAEMAEREGKRLGLGRKRRVEGHLLELELGICIEWRFDSGLASVWVLSALWYIFLLCGVLYSREEVGIIRARMTE